jgi:glycosyltransferase involved in cell wall biosynthesis
MTRQVVIVQRRLPEYRVPLFDRLKSELALDQVRLSVLHGHPTAVEQSRRDEGVLPWAVPVATKYLTVGGVQLVRQQLPRAILNGADLVVLPHESGSLFNYDLLARRAIGSKFRIAFWGHGPKGGESARERFKRWTAPGVDWWFAYTQLSVERVVATGFPADRVTCLENAIDTASLRCWAASISPEETALLRSELGIRGDHVAVALGSLAAEKRLPFLLATADALRRRIPDFELVLIGDGPERPKADEAARGRPWLHVAGVRHDREKARYCALGAVNLNPGMVGLGIVDSFALGLPIITTRISYHSPEIAYLRPDVNGLLTDDDPEAFASAAERALLDARLRETLVAGCSHAAERYTLENMAERFASGIRSALGDDERSTHANRRSRRTPQHPVSVAVIWQRFLPYHEARLHHLIQATERAGILVHPVEVASDDATYGFPGSSVPLPRRCCFPGSVYHRHEAWEVFSEVRRVLDELHPDVVFAPATPFPEGMAAIAYRNASGARCFMMDDAWQRSDQRGFVVTSVKRWIHQSVDGAFVPGPSHARHYEQLGFPRERIVFGVDVVDNAWFAAQADRARARATSLRAELRLPERFFLFVGRFIGRKGLTTLLQAFEWYRRARPEGIDLVLVGGTEDDLPPGTRVPSGATAIGRRYGADLAALYGLAEALVAPSDSDPWGLVVNEAMAAGLPVLVSRGCGACALVDEGSNGWTFSPRNFSVLGELMVRLADLGEDQRASMGRCSREIAADWDLPRFTEGVFRALEIPRAPPAGAESALACSLWRGRVRVY